MKSKKFLRVIALAALVIAVVATTAVAAPLPNGTVLSIVTGTGSLGSHQCDTGSCFSMEPSAGLLIWTDFGPGTDGGMIIGKDQAPGGQEGVGGGALTTPGELSAAWLFFGPYGTFATAPFHAGAPSPLGTDVTTGAGSNVFDDVSCSGAAGCLGKTTLGTWHVAWNAVAIPMGSALGCKALDTTKCQGVTEWTLSNQTYVLRHIWAVPNNDPSNFGNVPFSVLLRGPVTPVGHLCDDAATRCNDNNPCTDDTCNPLTGACINTNNTLTCDDNNPCTTGDVCSNGACQPGAPTNCSDNNACTTDTCDPATGCVNTPSVTCPTGLACDPATGNCIDLCAGKNCNDNNVCTTDTCDPANGACVHTGNPGVSCDDGNACTENDTCIGALGKLCKGTKIPGCYIQLQPNTGYHLYVEPTLYIVDPINGDYYNFGTNGNWQSSFTFGVTRPFYASQGLYDNPTTLQGRGRGTGDDGLTPNTYGDGWAGDILIHLDDSGHFTVSKFQVDIVASTAGGNFAQYGPVANMSGTVDAQGNMTFDPTGRLGSIDAFGNFVDNRWNIDSTYVNPTDYITFTTGTVPGPTSNGTTCSAGDTINGTPLWQDSLGLHAVLVQSSHVGADWLSFNGACYTEVWRLRIVPLCGDAVTRCNDNNPCTTDSCDAATGACTNTPIVCPGGGTCDPVTGCPGVVASKIGVFSNGNWYLDANQNWAWDGTPTDILNTFGIGVAGAVPVVGDWNGDGKTKVGIFVDGVWYLDMNGNGQWDGEGTDVRGVFGTGLPNAIPVTGDWNGDGITEIGIYSDGNWYLDANRNWAWDGTPTDTFGSFGLGLPNAIPVTGDWNGDGTTKIGIYSDGNWYLDTNKSWAWDGTPTDTFGSFGTGLSNAIPVTGDWNADGITEIGIYSDGNWYLDTNKSWAWDGMPPDTRGVFGLGLPNAIPVVGKW